MSKTAKNIIIIVITIVVIVISFLLSSTAVIITNSKAVGAPLGFIEIISWKFRDWFGSYRRFDPYARSLQHLITILFFQVAAGMPDKYDVYNIFTKNIELDYAKAEQLCFLYLLVWVVIIIEIVLIRKVWKKTKNPIHISLLIIQCFLINIWGSILDYVMSEYFLLVDHYFNPILTYYINFAFFLILYGIIIYIEKENDFDRNSKEFTIMNNQFDGNDIKYTEAIQTDSDQNEPMRAEKMSETINKGKNSEELLYCRRCGNKLIQGSAYCNKCGTKVKV